MQELMRLGRWCEKHSVITLYRKLVIDRDYPLYI